MYTTLLTEKKNHTLVVMLNRPKVLNALNIKLLEELETVIKEMYTDEEVKGAVIMGLGDKAFAAGADIAEFLSMTDQKMGADFSRKGHAIFQLIEYSPKPVIAAVNGFALGGGCELAMACHMRVASTKAKFGQPEVNLGIIAGYGGTQRLTKLIGRAKATEYLLTGEMIDAHEAHRLGLVNYVVEHGQLADKCLEILRKVYEKSSYSIALTLDAINEGVKGNDGYEREAVNLAKPLFLLMEKKEPPLFWKKGSPILLVNRKLNNWGKSPLCKNSSAI